MNIQIGDNKDRRSDIVINGVLDGLLQRWAEEERLEREKQARLLKEKKDMENKVGIVLGIIYILFWLKLMF